MYREEQANLGLANVLSSMGDLERKQSNYQVSIRHYENAFHLYDIEKEPMGKSYLLGELCRIYALAERTDDALKTLQQTRIAFDQMPENVRPYVAGCIKEAAELLGITNTESP